MLKKLLGYGMTIVGLVCVGFLVRQQGGRLSVEEIQKTFEYQNIWILFLATVLIIFAYYLIFPPFCILLEDILSAKGTLRSNPEKKKTVFKLFFQSNFAKYLPGNIFQFVKRSLLATTVGATQKQMGIVTIIEIFNFVFINAFYSALLYILCLISGTGLQKIAQLESLVSSQFKSLPHFQWALGLVIIITLVCFFVAGTWYLKNKKSFDFKRRFKEISWFKLLSYNFCFCVFNSFVFILVLSIYSNEQVWTLTLVFETAFWFTVSYLVGYLVPGAPGGMGVREALLLIQLNGLYSSNALVAALIVSRVLAIVADLFWLSRTYLSRDLHMPAKV